MIKQVFVDAPEQGPKVYWIPPVVSPSWSLVANLLPHWISDPLGVRLYKVFFFSQHVAVGQSSRSMRDGTGIAPTSRLVIHEVQQPDFKVSWSKAVAGLLQVAAEAVLRKEARAVKPKPKPERRDFMLMTVVGYVSRRRGKVKEDQLEARTLVEGDVLGVQPRPAGSSRLRLRFLSGLSWGEGPKPISRRQDNVGLGISGPWSVRLYAMCSPPVGKQLSMSCDWETRVGLDLWRVLRLDENCDYWKSEVIQTPLWRLALSEILCELEEIGRTVSLPASSFAAGKRPGHYCLLGACLLDSCHLQRGNSATFPVHHGGETTNNSSHSS